VEENMRGGKGGKARATREVVVVKEFVDRPFRNDNDRNLAEFESLENKEYSVPVWASGNYLIALCLLHFLCFPTQHILRRYSISYQSHKL